MQAFDKSTIRTQLGKYLELGLSPIPLYGKLPLVPWRKYQFDLRDFTKPGVNVGIPSGILPSGNHLWFIDIDDKKLLGEVYEKYPSLMDYPLVSTRKGFHIWLSWKEPVKTRVLDWGEIRGTGSYVVAPPSVHTCGHLYRFITPLDAEPPLFNPGSFLFECSKWTGFNRSKFLDNSIQGDRRPGLGGDFSRFELVHGVKKGRRHTFLVKYLAILHSSCLSEQDATQKALEWAARCNPPLPIDEVRQTVKSCYDKWDFQSITTIKDTRS